MAGGAGNGHSGIAVDFEHLLHLTSGNLIAFGCATVSGDDNALAILQGQHGRAVRRLGDLVRTVGIPQRIGRSVPVTIPGNKIRPPMQQIIKKAGVVVV